MMTDLERLLSGEFSGNHVKRLMKVEVSDETRRLIGENNREWWRRNRGTEALAERCKRISASYKKYIKEHGAVRTGAVLSDETKLKISKGNKGVKVYGKNHRARAVRTPLGEFDTLKRAAEAHGMFYEGNGGIIRKRIKRAVPGYEWVTV